MTRVRLLARIAPREESAGRVRELLATMTAATRQEPGNRCYALYESAAEEQDWLMLEEYVDEAALVAHRGSEHYRTCVPQIVQLLAAPIQVQQLTDIDLPPVQELPG